MPASAAPAAKAARPDLMSDLTCACGDTPAGGEITVRRAALRSAADGPTPSSSLNSRSVASTCASAASTLPDAARLLTSSTWAPSL